MEPDKQPLHTMQVCLLSKKLRATQAPETRLPVLPRDSVNLIGDYLSMPSKGEELLGLIDFIKDDAFNRERALLISTLKFRNLTPSFVNHHYERIFEKVKQQIAGNKNTLLLNAAESGNQLAVAQLLKIEGIDVNFKDNSGLTALMWAMGCCHTAIANKLLQVKGISVNARDIDGPTALIIAVIHAPTDALTELLKAKDLDVNARGEEGKTALMYAAITGRIHHLIKLLEVPGIELKYKDKDDSTALMHAAERHHSTIAHTLCTKLLFDAPASKAIETLQALRAETQEVNRGILLNEDSLSFDALWAVDQFDSYAKQKEFLEKALCEDNAFSALMKGPNRDRIIEKLKTVKEMSALSSMGAPIARSSSSCTIA